MAPSRGSRFHLRRDGSQRKVSWTDGPEGASGTLASSGALLFPVSVIATVDDLTITRMRGELLCQLLTASAVAEGFRYAFGMCVVSENAAGIGATAVPHPITDNAWDGWFYHKTGSLIAFDASVLEQSPGGNDRVVLDSKAMRKIHQTDVIIGVVEVTELGTATVQFSLTSRLLVKLP